MQYFIRMVLYKKSFGTIISIMEKLQNTTFKSILWLSFAHLACDIYGGFINPIMPFIASKIGFTLASATLILSIANMCSYMMQPLFGFFADNTKKRIFIFWGLVSASIFVPSVSVVKTVPLLVIFMILGCMGCSVFHPQATGFINKFSDKNCTDNMGIFISTGSLGFALGPLISAGITQFCGLEKIVYTSVFGIILALTMFICIPKMSKEKNTECKSRFLNSFKEILENNQMRLLMIIALMKSLVTNSSCILLPFLWKSQGYPAFYIGLALFLFVFAGALGSFLSPKIEKHLGKKPVLYFSLWGTFPMMAGLWAVYKTHPVLSLFVFFITGFVTMLAQPITMVWAQKTLPKYKSITAGFINGFCAGTAAVFISFLGTAAQSFGIMNVLLVISFIPAVSSFSVKYLKEFSD